MLNQPATHLVAGTTRDGSRVFYTGAAGEAFVSPDPARAFVGWYESGARAVAARLNRASGIHGVTFTAAPAALLEELSS